MRVEFPRGSGLSADYEDDEIEEMISLRRAADEGRLPRAEAENACRLIHATKVHFSARIVPLAEAAQIAGIQLPDQDSPLKIPDAVLAELVRDALWP